MKYARQGSTLAFGGRCETAVSADFSGSGRLEAYMYIHSNVITSSGVFTVGILPGLYILYVCVYVYIICMCICYEYE